MDTRIQRLVDWTESEVAEQASKLGTTYRSQPDVAIRAFYPRLYAIQKEHGVYGFAPGDAGGLNFLHFHALCPANFLDIHSKYDNAQDFKNKHGLFPSELAEEIANNRALAMFNGDPTELGSRDIDLLSPLLDEDMLGNGRMQLGRNRTRAFNQWMSPGGFDEHEETGRKIYKDYFSNCPANQIDSVFEELRIFGIGKNSNEHRVLKNVVSGRWASIGCLRAEIVDELAHAIAKAPNILEQAQLLNFVKDAVCAPVTAARGGLFRSTPRQYEQSVHFRSEWVKDCLFDLLNLNISGDQEILTSGMVSMLIDAGDSKAFPADLDYGLFSFFRKEGCYQVLYDGIRKATILAEQNLDQSNVQEVLQKASREYDLVMRSLSTYTRTKNIILVNDTIAPILMALLDAPVRVAESIGTVARSGVPKPGVQLAHAVLQSHKLLGKTRLR